MHCGGNIRTVILSILKFTRALYFRPEWFFTSSTSSVFCGRGQDMLLCFCYSTTRIVARSLLFLLLSCWIFLVFLRPSQYCCCVYHQSSTPKGPYPYVRSSYSSSTIRTADHFSLDTATAAVQEYYLYGSMHRG